MPRPSPFRARPAYGMAQTLIVGFGRAGRELHLGCLMKLRDASRGGRPLTTELGVVEWEEDRFRDLSLRHVEVFPTLAAARRHFGEDTVVHICTPPSTHLRILRDAARQGYYRMLVEKPLVDRSEDLTQLHPLVDNYGLLIFVVSNWLTSSLTGRIGKLVENFSVRWSRMTISQLKPRFTRTLSNPGHATAFEVEIPHQIALSLFLAGQDLEVRSADCQEMVVNGTTIPHMGQATVTLHDKRGRIIVLHSDLTAPVRQRSVDVTFEDGTRAVGYYPATDADSFSQLFTFCGGRAPIRREILFDDSLATFFTEAYNHFAANGRRPVSDVVFNASVVSLMSKAKSICGLPT
jgi:predicted dehydrogenase